MNRIFVLLFLVLLQLPVGTVQAQSEQVAPKIFILLRHAEKVQTINADPSLSLRGTTQAETFAELLKEQEISVIYSTPYRRTQETVAPLAAHKSLPTQLYEPLNALTLLEQLKASPDSGAVVIVGHSNTIPDMVNALLGREEVAPISEEVYGLVFIVTLPIAPGSAASLIRLHLPAGKTPSDKERVK